MKKFILGALTTLGVIGLGKLAYNEGRKDGVKESEEQLDNFFQGMKTHEEFRKEIKERTDKMFEESK